MVWVSKAKLVGRSNYTCMKALITIILVGLVCHQTFAQKSLTFNDKDFRFVLKIDSSEYGCAVSKIDTYRQKDNGLLQTLTPTENNHPCDANKTAFIVEDMNFDGQADFRLLEFLPAAANMPYLYWLYDSKAGQFKINTKLARITSPDFDKNTKVITSSWTDGCCRGGTDLYRYQSGRLVLFDRRIAGVKEDGNEYSEMWQLKSGVLVRVKK